MTHNAIFRKNDGNNFNDSSLSQSQDQHYDVSKRPVSSYESLIDNMGSQSTTSSNHSHYENDNDAHYPEHGYIGGCSTSSDLNAQGEYFASSEPNMQEEYYS